MAHASLAGLLSPGLSLGFQDVLEVGEAGFEISLYDADHNGLRQPEEAGARGH